jgi:hypothetical protein
MSFRVYGIEESSVARDLIDQGIAEGMAQGMAQGIAQGMAQGLAQGIAQGIAQSLPRVRRLLLNQGRARFGPPSQEVVATFEGIDDLDRLEAIGMRLLEVSTWDELLAEPRLRDRPPSMPGGRPPSPLETTRGRG